MKRTEIYLPAILLFAMGALTFFISSAAPVTTVASSWLPDTVKVKSQAPGFYVEMKGTVRSSRVNEKDEGKALDSALVTIYSGAIPYSELWTNKKGKCIFKLPLDKVFSIEISKAGYVTKFFEVNTKVPADKKDAFSFNFDIDIFAEVKNLDVSVLQKPIAKVAYNIIMEQFAYDVNYTSRINFELKKLYKNYYLLQKMEADTALTEKAAPKK